MKISIQDNSNLNPNAQETFDIKAWAKKEISIEKRKVENVIIYITESNHDFAISADFYCINQDENFLAETWLSNISS